MRLILGLIMMVSFLSLANAQELDKVTPLNPGEVVSEVVVGTGGPLETSTTTTLVRGETALHVLAELPQRLQAAENASVPYQLYVQDNVRADLQIDMDVVQSAGERRRMLEEIPINLLIVAVRTGLTHYGYVVAFGDTAAGWVFAASATILASNLWWARPDSWHKMQIRRIGEVYDQLGIDRKEIADGAHWKLNFTTKVAVNIIYGGVLAEIAGRFVGAHENSWITIAAAIAPSAFLNETIDHWSYGAKDPLFNRNQQRFLNFARQVIYSSAIITAVQHGNRWVAVGSAVVGVVAFVGYKHAPWMIESLTPILGPVLRPINTVIIKPVGNGLQRAVDSIGIAFANFWESRVDPLVDRLRGRPSRYSCSKAYGGN